MIFVTLGTQDKDFSRLLKVVEDEIKCGHIKEKVIVQAGYTKYQSDYMEIFDLIDPKKFQKLVEDCNILITHGGVGSILEGLKKKKKVIAAARLKKYREHTNDHQTQIVKKFAEENYILELSDFSKLNEILKKAKTFKPKQFHSNNKNFVKIIDEYITNDQHTSFLNKYRDLASKGYQGIILQIINVFFFSLFFSKLNFYTNIFLSYFLTFILNLLINYLIRIDYKEKIKYYLLNRIIILLLDLDIMYIFKEIIAFQIIYSKFITNTILLIISYVIARFCFKTSNYKHTK